MTKHFKARIEGPIGSMHAIQVWFDSANIISAATYITDTFGVMGIDGSNVTQLIEVDAANDEEARRADNKAERARHSTPRGSDRMR